ncbi:MAG TPA: hypothetical protein VF756_03660 [Thermoanaerobaculia bacterium]
MFFPSLSEGQRKEIAKQVAELIDAFTSEGRLGGVPIPPGLELCESCPEVILDLPRDWKDLLKQGAGIEQWIRRQVTWYHQLRTATKEFGFARSIEMEGGSHQVIEVVPSTVAHEFQKAAHFIDAEEPDAESPESRPSAFLLHIPRYAFYGLATTETTGIEKGGLDKITLVSPFFHVQIPIAEWKQASLLSFLYDLPDTFGVLDLKKSWLNLFPRLYHRLRRWLPF